MHKEDRTNLWKGEAGYIWSMIGSAVGFANILGFSSKAYHHGGGAFLVPFIIALLVLGLPLLLLEGIVGQRFNLPLVSAFGKVAGIKGKFFGWLTVLGCLTIGGFYTVLTGWSVAYTYFAAADMIPGDSASFFKHTFLHDSGSLTVVGGFATYVFIFTLIAMAFAWWVMVRNIQSGVERICSIFLPLLGILISIFVVAVTFLPGAFTGFSYYLTPDFSRLSHPRIWLDAFGHLFFSLSLGLGIVTGYARHADVQISIPRAMFWVLVGDFVISLLSGFAIFGCVGYLSQNLGVPFESLVQSTSNFEMGFVIFPMILKTFGPFLSRVVGALFFFCVFIAGVTGVFSIIESVAGNIEIEFNKLRTVAVTQTVAIMTALSLIFCLGNGFHIVGALEPMVTGFNMLIGGIAEIVFFMFGSAVIMNDAIWQYDERKTFAYLALRYLIIGILVAILFMAGLYEVQSGFGYPEMVRWGWFVLAGLCAALLARNGRTA